MIFRTATLLSRSSRAIVQRTAAFSTVALPRAAARQHPHASVLAAAAAVASLTIAGTTTHNHCQVPCGIFDDPAMIAEVKEAATTVRKAMVESQSLYGTSGNSDLQSMNQVVRWITTKEEHCDKIIRVMGDYCLCQRVKPASFKSKADYLQALELHHSVMISAMKAKQTMDVQACDALDHALADLAKMYT